MPLSYDTKLTDFCLDSLKMQDFLMELEDFFDITLGMHECAEVVTVSDLVEVIESKI
jgi:acyl carrier protein